MSEADAEQLLESLDRHFLARCPDLSTSQLREHEDIGSCAECRERAQSAVAIATVTVSETMRA
jgi:hypothetical protein